MTAVAGRSRFLEIGALNRLSHMRFGSRQAMEGTWSGRHRSRRQGGASEFLEHRAYAPGDDLRRLDWKVLGRTGRPYVRLYEDETNLVATVMLDVSGSMLFGSASRHDTTGSKLDHARFLTASLAYLIIRDRDRFGLAVANDRLDVYLPPAASSTQLDAVLHAVEQARSRPKTSLAASLRDLFPRLRRRGMLLVASDFLEDDLDGVFAALRLFRHQNFGVVLLHVVHPQEERLPSGRAFRFEGLEGEGHLNCSPQDIADLYERRFRGFMAGLRARAAAAGCAYHLFSTAVPYVEHLKSLLVERTG